MTAMHMNIINHSHRQLVMDRGLPIFRPSPSDKTDVTPSMIIRTIAQQFSFCCGGSSIKGYFSIRERDRDAATIIREA